MLEGRTIVDIRPMTKKEMANEYWHEDLNGPPAVIVLDDGTKLYPSQDPEGNGPGCLFGQSSEGSFCIA